MKTPLEVPNPFSLATYLPFSGPVNQAIATSWFSPSLTVNYQGSAQIEQRVATEVASFGRQIGWLSEIVDALAAGKAAPPKTLRRLTRAMRQIEEIKTSVRQSALDDAREALDRLREHAPEGLARLLKEESGRGPGKA
jgi:hypothetical protein